MKKSFAPWRCGRLVLAGAAVLGGQAQAAGTDTLDQSMWLRVESFRADLSTRVRIDDPGLSAKGTEFEFERYGMSDKKTLPALNLGVRFAENWRLEFEYFKLNRSGSGQLDKDIKFDDTTFPVLALLDTHLRSDVGRASVGYSFVRSPTLEVGAVGGVHVTKFDMSLQSTLSVAGAPATVRRDEKTATVPLPTAGAYGAWVFAPSWMLGWRADFFALKHKGYDGRLLNGQANVVYRFTPNAAVGGGVRYVDYKLRSDNSKIKGNVDYKFTGPQLFVELGF